MIRRPFTVRLSALLGLLAFFLAGAGSAFGVSPCPHHIQLHGTEAHEPAAPPPGGHAPHAQEAEAAPGEHAGDHQDSHHTADSHDQGSHDSHGDAHPCDCGSFCPVGGAASFATSARTVASLLPPETPRPTATVAAKELPSRPEHTLPLANAPPAIR